MLTRTHDRSLMILTEPLREFRGPFDLGRVSVSRLHCLIAISPTDSLPTISSLEGTIGIIAACIPTITPLFNPARRNSHGRMSRLLSPTDGSSSSRCREDKYRLHETVIDPGYLPSLPLSSSSPMPVSRHDGDTVEINGGKNVGIAETIISEGGCQSSSRRRSD